MTLVWVVLSGAGVVWLIRHDPAWIVPWVFAWIVGLLLVILATD